MRRVFSFAVICALIFAAGSCAPGPVPDASPSPGEAVSPAPVRTAEPSSVSSPSPPPDPEMSLRNTDPEALRISPRVSFGGVGADAAPVSYSLVCGEAVSPAEGRTGLPLDSVTVESVDGLDFDRPHPSSQASALFLDADGEKSDAGKDGTYRLELTVGYDKALGLGYHGSVVYALNVTVARAPVITLSSLEPPQGDALGISLEGSVTGAVYSARFSHLEKPVPFSDVEGKQTALVPVSVTARPGEHTAEVLRAMPGGEPEKVAEIGYTVKKRAFERQDLTVSGETSALYTNDNLKKDNEKVAAAKSASSPEKMWRGVFIRPADGRITTQFAQERYTNGKYSSRHSGADIAAPEGAEVRAAAGGAVVFSGDLIISGKTVIIDHGLSLFTSYCHLSEARAAAGDSVRQGDIIGLVGSTGYSTGPHLHYTATLSGSIIDAFRLEERDPLAMISQYED